MASGKESFREAFAGKTAIITGAASGLGKGFAQTIDSAGGTVIAADINLDGVEQVVAGLSQHAEAHGLDVTDSGAVAKLVDETVAKHGQLDYIFNNAGIGVQGFAEEIPIEDWDAIIDINLKGVAYGTSAAYRQMVRQGHGQIVNTASLAGLAPAPLLAPYSAVKFAVVGLSDSLRVEAQSKGVTVTALCPGYIESEIYANTRASGVDSMKIKQGLPGGVVPLDKGVEKLLDGVVRRKRMVTLPWYAHLLILSYKLMPNLSIKISGRMAATQAKKAGIS